MDINFVQDLCRKKAGTLVLCYFITELCFICLQRIDKISSSKTISSNSNREKSSMDIKKKSGKLIHQFYMELIDDFSLANQFQQKNKENHIVDGSTVAKSPSKINGNFPSS